MSLPKLTIKRESKFSDRWFIVDERGATEKTITGASTFYKSKERAELVMAKRMRTYAREKGVDERSQINKRIAAAKKKGLKHYEGSECRTCGGTKRYVCNNMCVVCLAEHNRKREAKRK